MAVPSYVTDLIDICLCESGDTFFEFSGYTLGDGAVTEADWYIQGASCASDENNGKTGIGHSIGFDFGTTVSHTSGDVFTIWMYYLLPNGIETIANGGYRVLIGESTATFGVWYVGGTDFGRNPFGGWQNFPCDPEETVDAGTQINTSLMQYFGCGYNCTVATGKGRPVSCDAMRFGRGQLQITEGSSVDGYATFIDLANENDNQNNVWGLFQSVPGGYLYKGLLSLGTVNTAVEFVDSNRVITIDDTPKVKSDFNRIEVNNDASYVSWSSINISAPSSSVTGTVKSRGEFEVVANAAVVELTDCTFTDMDTFKFGANTVIDGCVFRRCNAVTQNDAVLTGASFISTTDVAALYVDDINTVTGCTFEDNDIGLSLPASVTGSITFDGNTFDQNNNDIYWAGSSGTLTVQLINGANASTYASAGGNVVFETAVSFVITNIVEDSEVRIFDASNTDIEYAGAENVGANTQGLNNIVVAVDPDNAGRYKATYSYNYVGDTPVVVYVHNVEYLWAGYNVTLRNLDGSLQVSQTPDRQYSRGSIFDPKA